ncbi:MAG TPA: membrane protein insertion efficiency factor YidD [Terriglobales bacterium]|nr:membrane protein insertion efficiency factor YidD [Terriglobales bacterium]
MMIRDFILCWLNAYKMLLSPLFPPACRFVPTCSEYAMEAVTRYGAIRGSLKTIWRLLRCHPFSQGGYDPVVRNPAIPHERGELPVHICSQEMDQQLAGELLSYSPADLEISNTSACQNRRC